MPWIGGAIAGAGALLGGGIGASGAKGASNAQAKAAEQAAQMQMAMYQETATRLQPWVTTGSAANQQLGGLLGLSGYSASGAGGMGTGSLTTPFQPTMASLSQTPGYQFTLQQGLNAVRNQATAQGQGGGVLPGGGATAPSGPEGEGLAQYATNLASTTYQQQFQNYWTQLGNIYNMLQGASTSGANAAAGVGQAGTTAAGAAGNALQAAGAATGAGIAGATNQLTGALGNIGSIAQTSSILGAIQNMNNPTAPQMTGFAPAMQPGELGVGGFVAPTGPGG